MQRIEGMQHMYQFAFPYLIVNRTILEHHDIPMLSNLTQENRQQLECIHLKQHNHQYWIFSMLGELSVE